MRCIQFSRGHLPQGFRRKGAARGIIAIKIFFIGPIERREIIKIGQDHKAADYAVHAHAAFAKDMGHVDAKGEILPPYIWDDERRLHLRAKLDALYFILYGVYDPTNKTQSRDDINYIYSTFPIVERKEIAEYGRYRSRDLCLSYINAIMAGQPNAQIEG